jgi:regulator of nucleoside diphosphate kinase
MSNRKIIITTQDYQRLKALLASNVARLISGSNRLDELQADLNLAEVVSQVDMPKNVITMNSTVTLRDLHTQDIETYTLVYPDHADIANRKLSVFAPIGAAVLGYRVGDELQWRVPAGWRRLKVQNVIQSAPDGVFPLWPWCASN